MLNLAFSKKSLDVQRNVVIEEFKQRYLNQPYGDTWLLLRPLAYKKHPYRWPTIGKDINHIANATMDDVRAFYEKHYHPANAVLSVVGNITEKELRLLCEKWFAPIRKGKKMKRSLPKEPVQTKKRTQSVTRNVPFDMICMAYHMCARKSKDYYTTDFISDILSSGHSSRLYTKLVKEKKIFSELDAYITGDFDEGLFVFQGKLMKGKSMKQAEESIIEEISQLQETLVEEKELQKIKNKAESAIEFNNVNILNRALKLAVAELLGDTGLINDEAERYDAVTAVDIRRLAKKIFAEKNCSVLYYKAGRKK
jgi:predicted Zn-dependent peptidase